VALITFTGEHDLHTAPALRERLTDALDRGAGVVVDLSGAAFIDSSILGAVMDARRNAEGRGLGFAVSVSNGARPVERVLDVTGLRSTLPVHASREDAIAAALKAEPA
jgi:anti-sigma B factor antagonist